MTTDHELLSQIRLIADENVEPLSVAQRLHEIADRLQSLLGGDAAVRALISAAVAVESEAWAKGVKNISIGNVRRLGYALKALKPTGEL